MTYQPRSTARPLESTQRFRRESFWQVTFPVILVALLLIGGVVVLWLRGGSAGVSIVANYAFILIALLSSLIGLVVLGLVAALAFGFAWLTKKIPPYSNDAQRSMKQVYLAVDNFTNKIASVIITALATLSGLAEFLEKKGVVPGSDRPQ